MGKKTLASLLPELADTDLSGFEDLSAEEIGLIADAFHELCEARRHDFDEALDHSLRFVPGPLRHILRRVLFP
jgi:hypothetical protein